ncbi:hypothetical protein [Gabonia massiliensis]|uniref:hypothetical protein n=1 Tax=Gabonia massiliensis TaxID=1686296 RepID=UPI0006D7E7F7|nr:hypothetical protein [Gabonia massiliensis]
MKVTDIIVKTLEVLGEVNPVDESDLTNNSLPLEGLIISYIEKSLEDIFLQAPIHVLPWSEIPDDIIPYGDGSGYIILPDDYIRRFIIRMHGWHRDVTRVITEDDTLYSLQKNIVTRGGMERPICALASNDEGKSILEYYSLPIFYRAPKADKKLYIKRVSISTNKDEYKNQNIDCSDNLLVPIAMRCAYYVSISLGNTALAKYFEEEIAKQILLL